MFNFWKRSKVEKGKLLRKLNCFMLAALEVEVKVYTKSPYRK